MAGILIVTHLRVKMTAKVVTQRFVDRYTWSEAISVTDISAETITKNLFSGWIVKFGIPQKITTDQGH